MGSGPCVMFGIEPGLPVRCPLSCHFVPWVRLLSFPMATVYWPCTAGVTAQASSCSSVCVDGYCGQASMGSGLHSFTARV